MKATFNSVVTMAALAGLTLNAHAASSTTYSIEEQQVLQQTDSSTINDGFSFLGYSQFSLVAKVDTLGANLSAAPILTLPAPTSTYPAGSVTFPTGPSFSPTWATSGGYNRYQYGDSRPTTALLDAAYGSGTYTFTLGNATLQPTLSLDLATPVLPVTPMLVSGGTWSGGMLLVDPTQTVTLDFNSFTTYTNGLGGKINFNLFQSSAYPTPVGSSPQSVYAPTLGKTDDALTSFTIAPGTLTNGQNYIIQANFTQLETVNTTNFTGTGITGNPMGLSYYTTSTFITMQAIPEPSTMRLLAIMGLPACLMILAAKSRSSARGNPAAPIDSGRT